MINCWHLITGEYPPQSGGVSDYTRLVARGLAGAGDKVHVWAPACNTDGAVRDSEPGVEVHRLPDHFGPRSLAVISAVLKDSQKPRRLLVQYVPQSFGWKSLNLPFCFWLWSKRQESIWVMFHEVYFPLQRRQRPSHKLLGVITRLMALLVTQAAERIFVSIPAWEGLLKPLTIKRASITWLPVPSNVPVVDDSEKVSALRSRYTRDNGLVIGHFGTYGRTITNVLTSVLPPLLLGNGDRIALLLGRGGDALRDELLRQHPSLSGKIHATGSLPIAEISSYLKTCDLMIQPLIDGVSSRRATVMAAMAHGLPVLTTLGRLTETLWAESRAVALVQVGDVNEIIKVAEQLLADASERTRLGSAAVALYQKQFDIDLTIAKLRDATA